MRPSAQRCFPCPGNTLPGPCRISRRHRCSTFGFTSNARATSPIELPRSSRCTSASLHSLGNILLDNPMTQFSFGWILSLNWLCQKWGQVHYLACKSTQIKLDISRLLFLLPELRARSFSAINRRALRLQLHLCFINLQWLISTVLSSTRTNPSSIALWGGAEYPC